MSAFGGEADMRCRLALMACAAIDHKTYIGVSRFSVGGTTTSWRQELSGIIAQCLNLEHEIHHSVSKLCILGFEPLNWSLIAEFGDMSIRTASWSPSMLASQLQAQHILYPV
jgi:hypothetical protein